MARDGGMWSTPVPSTARSLCSVPAAAGLTSVDRGLNLTCTAAMAVPHGRATIQPAARPLCLSWRWGLRRSTSCVQPQHSGPANRYWQDCFQP